MTALDDPGLRAGATIGGYRIEGPIGAGGMGAVFAAVEPTIGKRVAIKVLRRDLAHDARLLMRFEREARSVGRVRHPAVVEVFAYGKLEDGRPYFVMPLYPGKSLRQALDEHGSLAPKEAWRIAREIADGLQAAHDEGVLHRDLKPDNVLLVEVPGRPSQPVVVDFGLAKLSQNDESDPDSAPEKDLTGTQGAMGTPAYMAPEQWWSHPVTRRTDQYAFGVLLFEMLAGRPPFVSQKLPELLELHLHRPPPKLADVGVVAPNGADDLIARMMAKDEAERFPSLADAVRAGARVFESGASAAPLDAHAATEIAARGESAADPRGPTTTTPHHLLTKLPVMGGLFGFVVGLVPFTAGYAGDERYRPGAIFVNAGLGGPLACLFAGLALMVLAYAVTRAPSARATSAALGATLLPGVIGTVMTYVGWQIVLSVASGEASANAFDLIHRGYFEASASRFIGLGLSTALTLALAASLATASRDSKLHPLTLALATFLFTASGAALVLRAPSAAALLFVSSAAVLSMARVRPHPQAPEVAPFHALAAAASCFTASGLAYTRVEARGAALWISGATRADRIHEIMSTGSERSWTVISIIVAVFLVVACAVLFVGRTERLRSTRPESRRFPLGPALFAGALVSVVALDLYFVVDFKARRQQLVGALAEQFALFAHLTPLSIGDRPLPKPSEAPALQITKDAVAVNGTGAARLAALDSPGGRQALTNSITTALAAPSASADHAIDLSVLVDKDAPAARVRELLSIAKNSGATTIELLFTRGQPPEMPNGGPPEVGHLLPSDFGALRIRFESSGHALPPGERFETIAETLLEQSESGSPVTIDLGSQPSP